jgi:hypothetical protein
LVIDPQAIADFFNAKKKQDMPCEVCSVDDWGYGNVLFELNQFQGGQFQIKGTEIKAPYLPLTCNNCGNTKLFNAITAGLVDSRGRKVP